MKTHRSQALVLAALLLLACVQVVTAFAVTYTNVFFNASQTRTVLASSINEVMIRSGDYTFSYSVDGYWAPVAGGQPTGRFFSVNSPAGVQMQAITAGPLVGKGANIILKRADGKKFDLKSFTGKILLNTAGSGAAFEIMPLLDGEDALPDPLQFDCFGYYGTSFSHTPSLVNYDTYKIHMWGDFAITALTLMDMNAPLTVSIAAAASSAAMGSVSRAGTYDSDAACTLTATASPGCCFVNSTEAGIEQSTQASYSFTASANRTLVANFAPLPAIGVTPLATPTGDFQLTWPSSLDWSLEESPALLNWTPSTRLITTSNGQKQVHVSISAQGRFFRLMKP